MASVITFTVSLNCCTRRAGPAIFKGCIDSPPVALFSGCIFNFPFLDIAVGIPVDVHEAGMDRGNRWLGPLLDGRLGTTDCHRS